MQTVLMDFISQKLWGDFPLRVARKDYQLFFKVNPKQLKPALKATLQGITSTHEFYSLYQNLFRIILLYFYTEEMRISPTESDTKVYIKAARNAYCRLISLQSNSHHLSTHPYFLGVITFLAIAKLIESEFSLSSRRIIDIHHAIHYTIYGQTVSDQYIINFLERLFSIRDLPQQLEHLKPSRQRKHDQSSVILQMLHVPTPALEQLSLKSFKHELRGKMQSLAVKSKGSKMVELQEKKRVIINPKKTRFDVNGVSASVHQSLSYKRIPYTKPQIAVFKNAYNPDRQKDELKFNYHINKYFQLLKAREKSKVQPPAERADDFLQNYRRYGVHRFEMPEVDLLDPSSSSSSQEEPLHGPRITLPYQQPPEITLPVVEVADQCEDKVKNVFLSGVKSSVVHTRLKKKRPHQEAVNVRKQKMIQLKNSLDGMLKAEHPEHVFVKFSRKKRHKY